MAHRLCPSGAKGNAPDTVTLPKPVLPESVGSVMIRPGKAAGMGARRRTRVRRTTPHSLALAGGKDSTAAREDQGLPSDPG
jgi:hypothetical protein